MSNDDKNNNSSKIINGINTIKSISNEFEFLNDNTDTELDELVLNFFKSFSSYISTYKNPSQKIKFSPKIYDAKNDYNIAKIYEKDGKLFLKSFNYENEFDKFFTQVNKAKEQKRKTLQSLKNGSIEYEIPLYKTLDLNQLNNKLYEDSILNSEIKYDVFNSIFFPENDRFLNKDDDLIFNLNQKMAYNSKGILLFDDDNNNYMNIENEENNIKEKEKEKPNDNDEGDGDINELNINHFNEKINLKNNNDNSNINININNNNFDDFFNVKNNKKSFFFKNNEIMLEISKYDNFIQENICLYLLNISNQQNGINYSQNINILNNKVDNLINNDNLNNLKDIIKSTDNTHILDLINHFNNIYTPHAYNKFSLFKNIKINNPSQVLNDINAEYKEENENNYNKDKEEENLMNEIKKYFDEELVKEINKDLEITQNFTHFYIEGNKFSKENMKKIISFLSKENFYMFAWCFNKEETKKYGLINNISKVATISNKVWFYINNKKTENKNQ